MSKTARTRLLAISALTITNLIWAAAIPIAKKAFNEGLTPALFLQTRFILAAIFCIPILLYLGRKGQFKQYLNSKTTLTIIILEFIGTFLALFLLYSGVSMSTAIDTTILTTSMPLFIALGGIIFLKEKETGFELIGLLLSFVGSIFLIFNGNQFSIDFKNTGNLLVFGHNLVVSGYYLLAKHYYKKINKFYVSGIGFAVGALFFSLASGIQPLAALTKIISLGPWSTLAVIYMALLGSIIALTFYLYGQDKIEASEAAIFNYLNPLFAIPLSYFLLSETIGQKELIAGILILVGVTIAQRRKK